jgi:DNA-binding response OmpR family regulator
MYGPAQAVPGCVENVLARVDEASVIRDRPDLILLDVNMPGMSEFEVCNKIRLSFSGPIIMVAVRNSEQDKILALDSGADDYVVKPFAVGELLARIRAAMRRSASDEPSQKSRLQN